MSELKLKPLSSVQPQQVEWLWYPYIPFGKVTILQGDPGEGKTMLMLHLIADLTRGRNLWEQEEPNAPMTCIYQTAEDGIADTIVPRLVAMDADLDNDTVVANVLANEKIAAFLAKQEGQIRKTIVVKNKLVNLIVK